MRERISMNQTDIDKFDFGHIVVSIQVQWLAFCLIDLYTPSPLNCASYLAHEDRKNYAPKLSE